MAILVTGGAGYIGSHTVLELQGLGGPTVVLDDLSTGFATTLPATVPLIQGDVSDAALLDRIIEDYGITEIIHFAAKTVVPDSVADPLVYYRANTLKTHSLVESAVRNGVRRFVFSSTAAVYGEPKLSPVPEDLAPNPINPYGRSKLMSEWMLTDAAQAHGLKFAILRYFNVAGADPEGRSGQSTRNATHLVKSAVQVALGRRPSFSIFGTDYETSDGTCVRDFIHVTDLARAHLAALSHLRDGGPSLTLNCGYGHGYSVQEVVDAVKRVSGVDFPVIFGARRAGDPASVVAHNERLRSELGWTPQHDSLEEIVRHALAWEATLS